MWPIFARRPRQPPSRSRASPCSNSWRVSASALAARPDTDRLGRMFFTLSPDEISAIRLSLRVACWAMLCSLPPGLVVAMVLARGRFWGKALLDGLVHLPLVLPPVVIGYVLLLLFGRR